MDTADEREDLNEKNSMKDGENPPTEESPPYLLCRTQSFDCRIDRSSCAEGDPVGSYESAREALEALRDQWEEGTCF